MIRSMVVALAVLLGIQTGAPAPERAILTCMRRVEKSLTCP